MRKALYLFAIVALLAGCDKKEDETTTVPVACFTYTAPGSTIFVDDVIEFHNCSTDAGSYRWDFGDGSTSTETNPTHSYGNSGDKTVTLVAYGKDDSSKTDTVMAKFRVWLKAIN